MAPFAKTGGLADVAGSLPAALGELGMEVTVVMPRYRGIPVTKKRLSEKVRIYFIENEAYFNRAFLYGNERGDYPDNLERFAYFCRRALALAKELGFKPDVLHAHDWHTALLPVLLKTEFLSDPFFKKTKSILTIHNLAYQGVFPARAFAGLGLDPELFSIRGFEFYGKMNLLKAGMLFADALSTVSPAYAREIQTEEFGCGLEGVIRERKDRLRGILNGIDTRFWNPARDARIKRRFSWRNPQAKEEDKLDFQERHGLEKDASIPLFGMVSRLVQQKGVDLLLEAAAAFLSRRVQLAFLGEGDGAYQAVFRDVVKRHPGKAAAFFRFHPEEAHRIYAASDFFLMPSLFEPCGLGQLIALRYGALPVARRTGGLADTVVDADEDPRRGNGFVFDRYAAHTFMGALKRALVAFSDTARFETLRRRAMKLDFSWEKSAKEYVKFYREISKGSE